MCFLSYTQAHTRPPRRLHPGDDFSRTLLVVTLLWCFNTVLYLLSRLI